MAFKGPTMTTFSCPDCQEHGMVRDKGHEVSHKYREYHGQKQYFDACNKCRKKYLKKIMEVRTGK